MVVAEPQVFCAICTKKCLGEVLRARGYYYHVDCFNCKECGKSLANVGFFFQNGEFFCTDDYHRLFGQSCHQCGRFIEGEAVSALGVTYHTDCFTCGDCGVPFPPGAKVNYDGDDYVCDPCIKVRDDKGAQPLYASEKVNGGVRPPYVNGGDAVDDIIPEPTHTAPVEAAPFEATSYEAAPSDQEEDIKSTEAPSSESNCAGCGNEIKSGQALLALDKQWHLWCFTCHKCGRLLAGEYMGRDGVPYCEEDYQAEFGVTCAGCGGYITGKVLQAGENHYHPQCLRCARCGQVSVEGEEMHLQGNEIWHPQCSEEYQKSLEEAPKGDFPSPPSSTRDEISGKRPSVSSHSSDFREPKTVPKFNALHDENQSEKSRPLSRDLSYSSDSLSTPAYSAKPFSAPKGLPASVSVKFTPGQRPVVTTNDKQQNGVYEPSVAKYESPKFQAPREEKISRTPTPPRTSPKSIGKEDVLDRHRVESQQRNENHQRGPSSLSGSDSGSAPARPPLPTRSTSHGWRSRLSSDPHSPGSPKYGDSNNYEVDGPPLGNAAITVNLKKEETSRPYSGVNEFSYRRDITTTTTTETNQAQTKISISTRSGLKTEQNNFEEPLSSSGVPSVLLRRDPTKDPERENKLKYRKSLPTLQTQEDIVIPQSNDFQENAPVEFNDRQASHRRSLPSLDKIDAGQPQGDLPTYPYDVLKTSNYKMPKDVDRSRLEAYLSDEEFFTVFKVSRENFYKMPQWRQADKKKRALLF